MSPLAASSPGITDGECPLSFPLSDAECLLSSPFSEVWHPTAKAPDKSEMAANRCAPRQGALNAREVMATRILRWSNRPPPHRPTAKAEERLADTSLPRSAAWWQARPFSPMWWKVLLSVDSSMRMRLALDSCAIPNRPAMSPRSLGFSRRLLILHAGAALRLLAGALLRVLRSRSLFDRCHSQRSLPSEPLHVEVLDELR